MESLCCIENDEVMKQLNVCRKTIFNVWEKIHEEKAISSNLISGRNCSILNSKDNEAVKKRMKRNRQRSRRKVAKELDISNRCLRGIAIDDLGLKPYKTG